MRARKTKSVGSGLTIFDRRFVITCAIVIFAAKLFDFILSGADILLRLRTLFNRADIYRKSYLVRFGP